jgi:predicted PurR-regulated permease PerM
MEPRSKVDSAIEFITRIVMRVIIFTAVAYFIYRVRTVLVVILIAAVVAFAIQPIVDAFCARRIAGMRRKTQKIIAAVLAYVLLIAVIAGTILLCVTPLKTEAQQLQGNFDEYVKNITTAATKAHTWYNALNPELQQFIESQNYKGFVEKASQWGAGIASTTVNFFTHIFDIILIPVLAFYFTLDSRSLKREILGLIPRHRVRESLALLHEMGAIMHSYIAGQIILCVIAGVAVGIILAVLKMPYILILSVFAGITRAIPVVGPLVSGAAIVITGALISPIHAINLLILFSLIQVVESKIIMPKLIGDRMQLHPVVVIVALLIGAEFFGILGMFMAAPVAAVLRIMARFYIIRPKRLHVWGISAARTEKTPSPVSPAAIDEA